MRPFEGLSAAGQVQRLRRLAEAALGHYDLGPYRLTPLNHGENTIFRVDAGPTEGRPAGERFVLRIHRTGYQTTESIRSELMWLRALRRDSELHVPEPVANRHGDDLTVADAPGIDEPRRCVLFRWTEGRFMRRSLKPPHLEKVGEFMARLHLHAEGFRPPPGFTRRRWDADGLFGEASGFRNPEREALLSPSDREVLGETERRVRAAMREVGDGPDVFGLLHADLHHGNYLFHRGEVRAIDFDDCGWGHYLYDAAVSLYPLRRRDDREDLRAALFRGYRRVRPFPEGQAAHLNTFMAGRRLTLMYWFLSRTDHPMFRSRAPQYAADTVAQLNDYLSAH